MDSNWRCIYHASFFIIKMESLIHNSITCFRKHISQIIHIHLEEFLLLFSEIIFSKQKAQVSLAYYFWTWGPPQDYDTFLILFCQRHQVTHKGKQVSKQWALCLCPQFGITHIILRKINKKLIEVLLYSIQKYIFFIIVSSSSILNY